MIRIVSIEVPAGEGLTLVDVDLDRKVNGTSSNATAVRKCTEESHNL